jgi:glycosyltransferase involved in cell wall biosynthesis
MTISLVMPVFNEERLIAQYIDDINKECKNFNLRLIVVNDCSKDNSRTILESLKSKNNVGYVLNNSENLGHGPSILKGLNAALAFEDDTIVSIDSDGQISAQELAKFLAFVSNNSDSIVEGSRKRIKSPIYRRIVSFTTRLIVFLKSGELPKDANTPLRAYPREAVVNLISKLSESAKVPNMQISILARRTRMRIQEYSVISEEKKSGNSVGSTWDTNLKKIPSRKFIKFCAFAFFEIVRF